MTVPEPEFLAGFAAQVAQATVEAIKAEGILHDDRPLLSVAEVAERLGVKERLAREMVGGESPRLASMIVGNGARRVEAAEVDRYLAERRAAEARHE